MLLFFTKYIQLLLFLQNTFNANNFEQVGGVFFSGVSIPESEKEEEERQGNDRKLELGEADILQSFSSLKKSNVVMIPNLRWVARLAARP